MALGFTVQYDPEEAMYRLLGPGGEEGDPVEFGYPATVEVKGQDYVACLDWEDEKEKDVELLVPVRLLGSEQVSELAEVHFEGLDQEDEDEEEDGDEAEVQVDNTETGAPGDGGPED